MFSTGKKDVFKRRNGVSDLVDGNIDRQFFPNLLHFLYRVEVGNCS